MRSGTHAPDVNTSVAPDMQRNSVRSSAVGASVLALEMVPSIQPIRTVVRLTAILTAVDITHIPSNELA